MEKIKEINRGFAYIEASIKKLEKQRISESGLNITGRELTYIAIINNNEGKTLSEIIGASGVTKATLSNQIKLLIKKGFVSLKVDSKDSRKKRVWLEETGHQVIDLHNKIREEIRNEYVNVLTENEVDILIKVGRKILKHLKGATNGTI